MYVFTNLSGENREHYDTINQIYSFQKTAYISRDYGIRYYVGPGKWIVGESERQREREKERERERERQPEILSIYVQLSIYIYIYPLPTITGLPKRLEVDVDSKEGDVVASFEFGDENTFQHLKLSYRFFPTTDIFTVIEYGK